MNGEFIPESELKISAYDLSVAQGVAAFEMTRSFNGVHFKLRSHLHRLLASCRALSLSFPWTLDEVEGWCLETAARNDHGPGEEHRLLIVVSPGCAPMYRELGGVIPHPFLYIADFPLRYTVAGFSKYFTEGVHCVTSQIQQVPDTCLPSSAKHRSRLHFHLAQMQAPAGTWPLMLDQAGYYTEAPGANLCGVIRGQVIGNSLESLPGISMQTAIDLSGGRIGQFQQIPAADELWLTGTPFCAISVASLDGKPIGDGKPGPVYKAMMEKWNNLVGLNIAEQIIRWDEEAS
jgi:branched-chain amino acid aminotransferase